MSEKLNAERLRALDEATKPWADFHGRLPDYDDPLRCVYDSGIQYAVELLAKTLDVAEYEICDGTEEFDGDLGGTMFNIVLAAMPTDPEGDAMHPKEVRAAILAMAEERDRLAHDLTVTGEQYATVCAENARMREALEPLANRNDSIGDDARRALGKDQAS